MTDDACPAHWVGCGCISLVVAPAGRHQFDADVDKLINM